MFGVFISIWMNFVGGDGAGGGGGGAFSPSLDFSDSRNSQYLGLV